VRQDAFDRYHRHDILACLTADEERQAGSMVTEEPLAWGHVERRM
jgi:hypothetical protein